MMQTYVGEDESSFSWVIIKSVNQVSSHWDRIAGNKIYVQSQILKEAQGCARKID